MDFGLDAAAGRALSTKTCGHLFLAKEELREVLGDLKLRFLLGAGKDQGRVNTSALQIVHQPVLRGMASGDAQRAYFSVDFQSPLLFKRLSTSARISDASACFALHPIEYLEASWKAARRVAEIPDDLAMKSPLFPLHSIQLRPLADSLCAPYLRQVQQDDQVGAYPPVAKSLSRITQSTPSPRHIP